MDENKEHAMHDHTYPAPEKKNNSQQEEIAHTEHVGMDHSMHEMSDHSAHAAHADHIMPASTGMTHEDHSAHAGHGTDHTGHEQMFRVRFWWCLLLSVPVLLYSGMIQMWLGPRRRSRSANGSHLFFRSSSLAMEAFPSYKWLSLSCRGASPA